jgi:polyisoprenoid-binding protein YceI
MTVTAAPGTAVLPAGTWTIDAAHSSVEFAVRHLGITTVKGRASRVDGTIVGGAGAAVAGVVASESITTFDESRDVHLHSPEFFDTRRHPELRFESTEVETDGDEIVVRGLLTIKGTTRPIELRGTVAGPETDPWGNDRIGVDLAAAIDRTQFGLRWNAPLPGGGFLLDDTVKLSASFSAVKTV